MMEHYVPVDELIRDLQRKIDDTLWEDPYESVGKLERQLKYFLNLQEEGVVYEALF